LAPLAHIAEPDISWGVLKAAMPEVLYAAVIAGGLAFTLQAVAQRYTSAASAAILLSSEALFAALFAALILGERLTLVGYLGCVLIFIALLMVELRASAPELSQQNK
jgi:drug/metabolite transporter (DMT)-like permease